MRRDFADVIGHLPSHSLRSSPPALEVFTPPDECGSSVLTTNGTSGGGEVCLGRVQEAGESRGLSLAAASTEPAVAPDRVVLSNSRRWPHAAASDVRGSADGGRGDGDERNNSSHGRSSNFSGGSNSSDAGNAREEEEFSGSDNESEFSASLAQGTAGRRQQENSRKRKGAKKAAGEKGINHRASGRCSLSREQKTVLKKLFAKAEFPPPDVLAQVAQEVGMDKRKVRICTRTSYPASPTMDAISVLLAAAEARELGEHTANEWDHDATKKLSQPDGHHHYDNTSSNNNKKTSEDISSESVGIPGAQAWPASYPSENADGQHHSGYGHQPFSPVPTKMEVTRAVDPPREPVDMR
ncbi:hypothetical protein HDU82_004462 [Entophlyctis luteolus]|nr:hypothetical protein HDU82_004462 [Entophlyctis luteolus]